MASAQDKMEMHKRTGTIEYSASDKRKALEAKLKSSTFRHLEGKEPTQQDKTWTKWNPNPSCYLSKNIKCSEKFFVLPLKAGNGSTLAVVSLDKVGRMPDNPPALKGHKAAVTAFDTSRIDPTLVVSGAQDGGVKVWKVPEGGLTEDVTESVCDFEAKGKVTVCQLSENVHGLLATGSTGANGHTLQIWDIISQEEACCMEGFHDDAIIDVQFDPYGHLVATSAKDGKVRVVDIRGKDQVCELDVIESLRDTQLCWVDRDHLLVYGTGKGSRRSLSLWNIRDGGKCLHTYQHDMSSATFMGYYDRDVGVLLTADNGGTSINVWEITTQAPFVSLLKTQLTQTIFQGLAFRPKLASVQIKEVQVAMSYKLSMDTIIPMTWTIPRKRLEFFQDDIFLPTWDGKALCDSKAWFGGEIPQGKDVTLVSLCPSDMTPLSEAPKEELTERQNRYNAHNLKKEEPKKKGILGHESAEEVAAHFTKVAAEMPKTNRFDATYDETSKDVDEDEWD